MLVLLNRAGPHDTEPAFTRPQPLPLPQSLFMTGSSVPFLVVTAALLVARGVPPAFAPPLILLPQPRRPLFIRNRRLAGTPGPRPDAAAG